MATNKRTPADDGVRTKIPSAFAESGRWWSFQTSELLLTASKEQSRRTQAIYINENAAEHSGRATKSTIKRRRWGGRCWLRHWREDRRRVTLLTGKRAESQKHQQSVCCSTFMSSVVTKLKGRGETTETLLNRPAGSGTAAGQLPQRMRHHRGFRKTPCRALTTDDSMRRTSKDTNKMCECLSYFMSFSLFQCTLQSLMRSSK